jgi:6-phosphogluconolactonase
MTEVAVVADVPTAAAELFIESVGGAVAARSRAAVALTGGSTAPALYTRLRPARVPWEQTEIFFSDERAVPPEHELSNYRMAEEGLLRHVRVAGVHRMRGEAPDLDAEARRCAQELRDTLGTPPRLVRHVAAPVHVEPKVDRLTMVPFLVVTARMVVLQVTGSGKAEVLARALKGPEDLVACPAQWLRKASGRVVVVCDPPAASRL